MSRPQLPASHVHPPVDAQVSAFHRDVVDEVVATVAREKWVLVGMAQNPFVRKARRFLEREGIPFTYLEYGSYLGGWKRRLAIKLWAGFPSFPMVFRSGVLLGGYTDLLALKRDGALQPSPETAASA